MALYLVTYDLHKQGQNYPCISQKLESLSAYWHFQGSVWLVAWDGSSYALAEHLRQCLDTNDNVFVTRVSEDSAWSGFSQEGSDWIQNLI